MLATLSDFLLGIGLSRRAAAPFSEAPRRSPSLYSGVDRVAAMGWHARVGTL